MKTDPRTRTPNGSAMMRAILSNPLSAASPSARHSLALAGAAWRSCCRHFRFHSFRASRFRRSSLTAMPSIGEIYGCPVCKESEGARLSGILHRSLSVRSFLLLVLTATLVGCWDAERPAALYSDSNAAALAQTRRIGLDRNGQPTSVALSEIVVTGTADPLPPVSAADVSGMVIRT